MDERLKHGRQWRETASVGISCIAPATIWARIPGASTHRMATARWRARKPSARTCAVLKRVAASAIAWRSTGSVSVAESVASERALPAAILHTNRPKVRNVTPRSRPVEIFFRNSVFGPVGTPTGPARGTWDTSHGPKKGLYNSLSATFGSPGTL